MLRSIIRKILLCKENESIRDTMFRHRLTFTKIFCRKKYSKKDFELTMLSLGIKKGDNILIHSSYRSFYNFIGTPQDIIDVFIKIVTSSGNIVMPCYNDNKYYFDVDNDKSKAGVLSEVFRKNESVCRSKGNHFSCAAYGKDKISIISEHEKSVYGFDSYSPYYKFVSLNNSKIIMLGLGKKSVKLSLYHIPEYLYRESDNFYKSLFNRTYSAVITYKNNKNESITIEKSGLYLRDDTIPNKREINKLYKQKFVKFGKISNLDVVVIDAKQALDFILSENKKGKYFIKREK